MVDGVLDEAKIIDAFTQQDQSDDSRDKIENMLNICKAVESENECERAFKIYECYTNNKWIDWNSEDWGHFPWLQSSTACYDLKFDVSRSERIIQTL